MKQRGRKSAAQMSVVVGTIDGRPRAPSDITKFQKDIWESTVAAEAADVFKSAALQQLLKEYCRHVETAGVLSAQIDEFDVAWLADEDGLKRYDRLLAMRDRETKAIGDKATKLRLTNQSRYTPQAAGTAAKKSQAERKPWQMTG